MKTPYGKPSGPLLVSHVGKTSVLFLSRHGTGKPVPPHRINHRANLWALRESGARTVISSASVGSLKKDIRPGTLLVPDDYLAPWHQVTYHEEEARHVTPGFDASLRAKLLEAAERVHLKVRDGGTYVQTLGPRLETPAEVRMIAQFGDVVGMTMAAEATLARELGLKYAALCSVDNYAHGITDHPLTFAHIKAEQKKNEERVRRVLLQALRGKP